ncbi:TPA: hypothetical protein ACF3XN_003000 [Vibrio parahaemolyticus]
MKLKKSTIATLKAFKKIDNKMMVNKGNRIRITDNLSKVIVYVDIEDSFPKRFGLYDLNEFLSVLKIIPDADLDFKEDHLIIKGDDVEVKYLYGDEEYIKEAPSAIIFPPINEVEYKNRLAEYKQKLASYEKEMNQYRIDFESYEEALLEYNDSKEGNIDIDEPVKPKEPAKPQEPPKPNKDDILQFNLTKDQINRLCILGKLLDQEFVIFSTEAGSNDITMSLAKEKDYDAELEDTVIFTIDKTSSDHESKVTVKL